MRFDLLVVVEYLPLLLQASITTVQLTLLSSIFGSALGLLCVIGRFSRFAPIKTVIAVYTWIMRGLPALVLILFIYYGLPAFGIDLQPFPAAVIALSLNVGAFYGEIFRAGVEAIPVGQWDAARSLGLRFAPMMRTVVLPQAFRIVIPPYLNGLISLTKETSLVSAITVTELTLTAQRAYSSSFRPLEILAVTTILYLTMTSALMVMQSWLERALRLPGTVTSAAPLRA